MSGQKDAVLYVHGLGGSAAEAQHYRALFPNSTVIGLDYHGIEPWTAGKEIRDAVIRLHGSFESIRVIGNSIGAFLVMHADLDTLVEKAYLISPVVDMELIIRRRMAQENVTEEELRKKGTIPSTFGPPLSWDWLCWVAEHPVEWNVPTMILYGDRDELTPYETIISFSQTHGACLTVMHGGGHWFHTKDQMQFLDDWLRREQG